MSPTRREVIRTAAAMLGAVGASRADATQSVPTIPLPTPRAKALMHAFALKYPIFQAPHGNSDVSGTLHRGCERWRDGLARSLYL